MSEDVLKISYHISTDKIGSKCEDIEEVNKEEWEGMTDVEQEEYMREIVFDHVSWSYKVEGGAEG